MVHAIPWTLTISSDLRLLGLARSFVEAVCRVAGFDEQTTYAIVLATDEATNNIMRHAHRDRPDAPIQIQCYFGPDGIEIHLLDEGEPFNIETVPHLDPSELRIGGRGVFLMRTLMDELSSQPRGAGSVPPLAPRRAAGAAYRAGQVRHACRKPKVAQTTAPGILFPESSPSALRYRKVDFRGQASRQQPISP
jgi:serine/threonine-protein kinase RsbW